MSPDQIEGQWWLPESPARRRFGRLVLDGDESWHLVVEGGLSPPHPDGGGSAPGPEDDWPKQTDVLYGRAHDGSAVSLFNCWSYGIPWPDEQVRETWHFHSIAQGYEPVAPSDLVTDLRVGLGSLLEWAGGHRPVVDHTDDWVTITSASVHLGTAKTDEATIRLDLGQSWKVGAARAEIVPCATFCIEPSAGMTFDIAMNTYVQPLRELITFLTLSFVELHEFTARPVGKSGATRRLPPTTFRTQLQRPARCPPALSRHQMLAPLPSLPGTVDEVITRWFALRTHYRKVISFLLLPHSAPYLYSDDKFMTAFLAFEDYHSRAIGGTAVDPATHKERVDAIVAAAPPEYRTWTEEMLRGKNTKGQKRKLKEVIERAGTTGTRILQTAPNFGPYASEWGERVLMRGGRGRLGQVTPPAWRSTRSL